MKKNVFSRAIAVLASMTVLGAASMMSASAKGIASETVTVTAGVEKEATVGFYITPDLHSAGANVTFTAAEGITITEASGSMAKEVNADGSWTVVYASSDLYPTDKPFTKVTVSIDTDVPGEYPIALSITELNDDDEDIDAGEDGYVDNPTAENGVVVIEAAATEPEPTDAPTAAPTDAPTAAPTTAATTTAKPKSDSPKTGTAGVAVAVLGLVTAGATAVVLKKKH